MSKVELASLKPGESAIVAGIIAEVGLEQRLLALGFRSGKRVQMLRKAWLNGPLHIRVGTTEVMVRRCDANAILLTPQERK
jgi:ferrous iron transport protein A